MPTQPNRLLALPLVGGIFRFAVLVPVFIFLFVGLLVMLVYWFTWIPVLLIGRYPEGLFNLMVYSQRLQLRLSAYTFGHSDRFIRCSTKRDLARMNWVLGGMIESTGLLGQRPSGNLLLR